MLIQLMSADDVLVSQSPFLRLAEPLSLQLLVCKHSQSVPHSVLVFQMLSSLLLVHRGLVGVSDVVLVFQMLSLKLLVHRGLVGVSDTVLLSLPREWKIAFLSWQSGVTG